MKLFFALCLFLLALSSVILGQEPVHRKYSTREGLSSNEVYEVIQDSKGFIWMSTNKGVCRFDGYQFTRFNIENGLADNSTLGIIEDNKGRIWCRSISGKISYIENDVVQTIQAEAKNYYPNSMLVDGAGNIWCGSQTFGISYKIAPPYTESSKTVLEENTSNINIYLLDEGIFFSRGGFANKPSKLIFPKTGERLEFTSPTAESNAKAISIGENIAICSGNFISIVDRLANIITYDFQQEIRNVYFDQDQNLWLCMGKGRGVARIKNCDFSRQPEYFFQGITISSMLQDREGGYWFTTLNDGVQYVPSLSISEYNLEEIKSGEVISLLRGDNAAIVLNHIGLSLTIHENGTALQEEKRIAEEKELLPKGIRIINKKKAFLLHEGANKQTVHASSDFYSAKEERALLFLKDQPAYITNTPLHVIKVDNITNSMQEAYKSPSRINGSFPLGDSLILACNDGLISFHDGQFHNFSSRHPDLEKRINHVSADNQGRLWVATNGHGVYILSDKVLFHLDRHSGLNSNICNDIFLEENTTTISTDEGVCILKEETPWHFSFQQITSRNGLPGRTVTKVSRIGGILHILTDDGLFKYQLDSIKKNIVAPPIYIQKVSINGEAITNFENMELDHNQNYLSVSFIGLSFIHPESNYFKYKLDGIDNNWVYTSNKVIQYPSLPPGDYTFHVLAINSNDTCSDTERSFRMTIRQPFWKTWWFISIVTFLIVVMTFLFTYMRINRIRTLADEREKLNSQIADIEMKALRAQMNPHFIFNCINSIQHYVLEQDKLIAHKLLSRFSRLVRNVLENSNKEWINVEREIVKYCYFSRPLTSVS
jgi:ligand-binding sensor domain-containing protein